MANTPSTHTDMKKVESGEVLEKSEDFDIGEISDLDDAEKFLRENNISHAYVQELMQDKAAEKRLVRKIDLIILPLLCGTYVLQFIDKNATSYGAVFDLLSGTHTSGSQYALLGTWFSLGYLISEYPITLAAQKYNLGKIISACMYVACFMSWGAVLMLTATTTSYSGLAACRFFLGIFEAPMTPCFMMVVALWYTRKEAPLRAGIFYCMNGVGGMLGGILTYAIGQENTYPVYKVIFLLLGGLTFCWGLLLMFLLPSDFLSTKRLTTEDKALLIGRSQSDQTGIISKKIQWDQIKECFMDGQVWILFLFVLLNSVVNGGIGSFGTLILKGVVTGKALTAAYNIPQGAFQVFWILGAAYISSRFKNMRTIVMAVYNIPTLVGVLVIWKLPRTGGANKIGLLIAYYIVAAYVASLVQALQMPASNIGGYTKRVTATAFVFVAYCIGNMVGGQGFRAEQAPIYQDGCILILSCCCGQIALMAALRLLLIRRNKERDATGVAADFSIVDEEVLQDLTDFKNPHFRYYL